MKLLRQTALLLFLASVLYFVLLHSHALWQSPTLVQDRWKKIFYPFVGLFPESWIRVNRGSDLGYVVAGLYVLLVAAMALIYARAVRASFRAGAFKVPDAGSALRWVVFGTVAALAVLLIVPGVLSTDLFSYIWYGRILSVYGQNPFTHVPADYTWYDPGRWLPWVYWKETPSVYGPVWVMFAGIIASIAQALDGDIVNHILGHKILADLAHLANIVLIWKIAGIVVPRFWKLPRALPSGVSLADRQTGAQIAITLVYAWNPLMLIDFGANGHNDILMVTGVLGAILLHLKGQWRLAVVAFGLAAMVKFIAVIFVPGYLWLLFWEAAPGGVRNRFLHRASCVAQAVAILAVTQVLGYLPFWEGPATIKPLFTGPPVELYVNSLGDLIRYKLPQAVSQIATSLGWQPLDFWTPVAIGNRIDWPLRWGANIIVATVAVLQTWKARTFPAMVVAWGWVLFTYLAIGSVWYWPWYVCWLLPVVALVGPGVLFNATLILSVTSLLLYATNWRSNQTVAELETWKSLLLQAPALTYLGIAALRARKPAPRTVTRPIPHGKEAPEAVRVPTIPARTHQPQLATARAASDFDGRAFGGSPAESFSTTEQMDC